MTVADAIPDLWRSKEDTVRLYQLFLCRLLMNDRHERVIAACRQIQRYAARGPGAAEALFSFPIEIDALCALKDYDAAWRRLRRQEEIAFGRRLDLRSRKWSKSDRLLLAYSYAPLLYFRGRYRLGCQLLETSLAFSLSGKKSADFDILFHVYNDEVEPSHYCRVTLSHFYARLDKDLRRWRHWRPFVNGFRPRLFRLADIRREELMADPAMLKPFLTKLTAEERRRTPSGIGSGPSDLTDSPAKVRKRQVALNRKLKDFRKRIKPVQEESNRKLRELFPELRQLPR